MTIFQQIIDKKIPANIVYEDEWVLGFHDIAPQAPVHVLFIPKIPVENFLEASCENGLMQRLFDAIHEYVKKAGLNRDQIRLVTNCGALAGQSVFHFHIHLLSGRNFSWPPG